MSTTPLRRRFSGIPVQASSGIPTPSAIFTIPETPLRQFRTTRLPVPVTPQAQEPEAASTPNVKAPGPFGGGKIPRRVQKFGDIPTHFTDTETSTTCTPAATTAQNEDVNPPLTFSKLKSFKPIQPAGVLRNPFTPTAAHETYTGSAKTTQLFETTTVHQKYERFEEFVAVQKKHERSEEIADGMAINNKYRCMEDSGSNGYRTRLPVLSSARANQTSSARCYTMPKTPTSTACGYDLRDAYIADMGRTPINRFSTSDMQAAYDASIKAPIVGVFTTGTSYKVNTSLKSPTITRGKRLRNSAKSCKAGNLAMPASRTSTRANAAPVAPLITRGNNVPTPSKKTMTYPNPCPGISLEHSYRSTPQRNNVTTSVDRYIAPEHLLAPATPAIQLTRTSNARVNFTAPVQTKPVIYEKMPQKITVINGIKRSVGHDERFPILRRVRKNESLVEEGTLSTDTTDGAPVATDGTAANISEDVGMSDN
ncbi:hypothetical protein EV426DRAFT_678148 [Tirmania nivea]|nr:hypothetical protein EV426DRAFT_678148 [Tirmania nivea]